MRIGSQPVHCEWSGICRLRSIGPWPCFGGRVKSRPAVVTAVIAALCGCSFASEPATSQLPPNRGSFRVPAPIATVPSLPLRVLTQRLGDPLALGTPGTPAASLELDAYRATPDGRKAVAAPDEKTGAVKAPPVIVPEPSAFALMLAGVSVVIFLGARRRRH